MKSWIPESLTFFDIFFFQLENCHILTVASATSSLPRLLILLVTYYVGLAIMAWLSLMLTKKAFLLDFDTYRSLG